MTNTISDDILNDANNAQPPPSTRTYFGQMTIDAWYCILVKGTGKVLYDPSQHSADQKRTAIDLTLTALPSARINEPIKRELIAESKEWTQIVRPSLQALSVDLRQLNNRFVQIDTVPVGRKYTNASGEEKELTTFKFTKIFANEADCQAGAEGFFGPRSPSSSTVNGSATSVGASASAPTPVATADDPRRKVAAKFLPNLLKGLADLPSIEAKLAQPIAGVKFEITDPEVMAIPEVQKLLVGTV